MNFFATTTTIGSRVAKTIDLAAAHGSRDEIIRRSRAGSTLTDSNLLRRIEAEGWDRLSQPVARRIREQFPDDRVVYAVYALEDLRRPDLPICTYGEGEDLRAGEHAKDHGDAVVASVHKDGTVSGCHARDSVTRDRLLEAASRSQPDTWRIVAAIMEMQELTARDIRLSQEAVTSIRAGDTSDDPTIAVYDWRDLHRPVASFPWETRNEALNRMFRRHHLAFQVYPSGKVYGHETDLPDATFAEVLENLNRATADNPGADALALLAAALISSHWDEAHDLTVHSYGDDLAPGDIPENEHLVDIRRRYVAALGPQKPR